MRDLAGADLVGTFELRGAAAHDADRIVQMSTGPVAGKRLFVVESFTRRRVFGAYNRETIVGYAIWDRAFFGRPFVWLLGVDPAFRRRGIAAALVEAFAAEFPGQPLFTSTNESNDAMHALLAPLGFVRSGSVENLDPGDPEIFYFRRPHCGTA